MGAGCSVQPGGQVSRGDILRQPSLMSLSPKVSVILEIISASNVPKMDVVGHSDTYVVAWASDPQGEVKSKKVRTLTRRGVVNPVWHCIRELRFIPDHEETTIHLHLYDRDAGTDDYIGHAEILLDNLDPGATRDLPVKPTRVVAKVPCLLRVRRLPLPTSSTKTVFLIRHGESKWNEAQKKKRWDKLAAYDHPLNQAGYDQAVRFREHWSSNEAHQLGTSPFSLEESWSPNFVEVERIFSSPLSRALQTCLVATKGHPAVIKNGVTLLSAAREIKRFGGMDTVGKAVGEGISERIKVTLRDLVGEEEAKELMKPELHFHDVQSDWWSTVSQTETDVDISERMHDLSCTLKCIQENSIAVVGHSLFFREFVSRHLGDSFVERDPSMTKQLRTCKLSNGGCIGLRMSFSGSQPEIKDAVLMYDTHLH
eukprot:NODE_2324_length_1449_cov_88.777526_g2207_i0.p1 GENE.NODE_2324_length_1449_cov_88.777526_g2207_i0~~NODE_2324_length_1449_cov_88.777526_g2207_i0.p1  ORF type:complete len:426 (+),score=59.17 NODE_2324_length_1449_cov_88.777526_g2207_i0:123-1400(+)